MSLPTITDPRHASPARGLFDRLAMRLIRDERDLPFARLGAQIGVVMIPFAAAVYALPTIPLWVAVLYAAVHFGVFFDRFTLMLHNVSHRPFFKREHRSLNLVIQWVLCPIMGQTPYTYYSHHVGMHHAEGNMADDLSSTLPYQRDSFGGWLRYWLDFMFLSLWKLALYHARRAHKDLARKTILGELSYFAAVGALAVWNWQATLLVFGFSFVMARILMMVGNWAQHAFIDVDDPSNDYKSSIVCINTRYNRRCFNDGYHVGHHVSPTRHWTDMPRDFERHRADYVRSNAVVFNGIDYFQVWLLLMFKRYDALARRFVELRDTPRSHEEIVQLLKSRTRRTEPLRASPSGVVASEPWPTPQSG